MAGHGGEGKLHYGVARVELHLPGVSSLKAKRALLNRAKAALDRSLAVSVTEVGFQEQWQRSILGVAVAASTATGVDRVLDRITDVIERDPHVEVVRVADFADVFDEDAAG